MLIAEMHADSITTNLVSFRSIIYHALLRIQVFLNERQHLFTRGKHNNIVKHLLNWFLFIFSITVSIFTRFAIDKRHLKVIQM